MRTSAAAAGVIQRVVFELEGMPGCCWSCAHAALRKALADRGRAKSFMHQAARQLVPKARLGRLTALVGIASSPTATSKPVAPAAGAPAAAAARAGRLVWPQRCQLAGQRLLHVKAGLCARQLRDSQVMCHPLCCRVLSARQRVLRAQRAAHASSQSSILRARSRCSRLKA